MHAVFGSQRKNLLGIHKCTYIDFLYIFMHTLCTSLRKCFGNDEPFAITRHNLCLLYTDNKFHKHLLLL